MSSSIRKRPVTASLVTRLVDMPDLAETVRALPDGSFGALVRRIGVEDAGELVAVATTEQLVSAFDEDLFSNEAPGERETFDVSRFALWLEVLLEAGDSVAAERVSELSEDFVSLAFARMFVVLDHDALMERMSEGGDDVDLAEKAIESCLSEEIDGYLLVSRLHDGWDAALSLVLALDRDHRAFLVRVLDRCADLASPYVEDLDELTELLTGEESLEDDVEAERDERRSSRGFVEPRAAKNFLRLAVQREDAEDAPRDPVTRAYFRDLDRSDGVRAEPAARAANARLVAELASLARDDGPEAKADAVNASRLLRLVSGESRAESDEAILAAMRTLRESSPDVFEERMEELAFLANVLIAGATSKESRERFRPFEAAEAALATVALGAERARRTAPTAPDAEDAASVLVGILRTTSADRLFRIASSHLATRGAPETSAFVGSLAELRTLLDTDREAADPD